MVWMPRKKVLRCLSPLIQVQSPTPCSAREVVGLGAAFSTNGQSSISFALSFSYSLETSLSVGLPLYFRSESSCQDHLDCRIRLWLSTILHRMLIGQQQWTVRVYPLHTFVLGVSEHQTIIPSKMTLTSVLFLQLQCLKKGFYLVK